MSTFVLVHGGWHGGWVYQPVARLLSKAGHEIYRPTLLGLAELSGGPPSHINLQRHVEQISALIEWEDLSDIILVGHSYGGFVITGVADALPQRIAALVYLDAFVPRNGDSLISLMGGLDNWLFDGVAHDGCSLVPPEHASSGLNEAHERWTSQQGCRHPVGTALQALRLTGAYKKIPHRTFIVARASQSPDRKTSPFQTYYQQALESLGWRAEILEGGHNLMLDNPEGLARILSAQADFLHQQGSNHHEF